MLGLDLEALGFMGCRDFGSGVAGRQFLPFLGELLSLKFELLIEALCLIDFCRRYGWTK